MKKDFFSSGILYMIASATSLSLIGLFGQIALQSFSLESVLFWRFFCGFILCWIFLQIFKQKKESRSKLISKNLFRSLFVLGSQYSFFFYLEKSSLLNAMSLLNTGPLFIPLIGWVFFRHKMDRIELIGLFVCFAGVLCVIQPESSLFSWASLVGLLGGVCQAISQSLFGINAKEESASLNVFYLFFFCAIGSLIPYLFFDSAQILKKEFVLMDVFLFLILGVFSLSNQLFRGAAYKQNTPSKLSAFLYFAVLFSGFLDWIIFKKTGNLLSVFGALLIISGGSLKTLVNLRKG